MRLDVAKDESAKSKNDVFKIRIQKFQCPENFVKMMRFLTVTVWLWTMLFPNLDIDTSRIAIVSAPPQAHCVLSSSNLEPIHRKQRSKD